MATDVTTFMMFQGHEAEEAMTFYTGLFKDAEVHSISRYGPGDIGAEGTVRHARFTLAGREFMCIDSPIRHDFTFTPSMSLYVECESEDEIDGLFDSLGDGGAVLMALGDHGIGSKFGWVNDRFGISWQLSLP
jgi:predicted 3-demethylubiquinone-9 3-methyltransferase (glyoxalase superfamily)